jgi:hypothetical protein
MHLAKGAAAVLAAALLPAALLFSFRNFWGVYLVAALPWMFSYGRKSAGLLVKGAVASWPGRLIASFFLLMILSLSWTTGSRGLSAGTDLVILVAVSGLSLAAALLSKDRGEEALLPAALAVATAVSLLLLLLEGASGSLLRQSFPPAQPAHLDQVDTGHGLVLALVLMPAALLWLRRRSRGPWPAAALFLAAGGAAALSALLTSLAMFLAAAVIAAASLVGKRLPMRLAIGFAALATATPLGAFFLPPAETIAELPFEDSTLHRLIILKTLMTGWSEGAVWVGEGIRSVDALTASAPKIRLESGTVVAAVSAHAHHIFVQIVYEFGILGYLLFTCGCGLLLRQVWRADLPAGTEAAAAMLLAVLTAAGVSHMDLYSMHLWCAAAFSLMAIILQGRALR